MKYGSLILGLAAILSGCQSPSHTNSVNGLQITGFGQSLAWTWTFERSLLNRPESEAEMGKWASSAKKGSQGTYGQQSAPLVADFTVGAPAAGVTPVTRLIGVPLPSGFLLVRTVKVIDGSVLDNVASIAVPVNAQTPTVGAVYKILVAWGTTTLRFSEYTSLGTVVGA